jgi:hypothetical protein
MKGKMNGSLDKHDGSSRKKGMRIARPDEREHVGRRINPETAYVDFSYAQILDPYGDTRVPDEAYCVGRVFFAADPDERVWVCFYDLPEETVEALRAKRQKADAEGWEMLLGPRGQWSEAG